MSEAIQSAPESSESISELTREEYFAERRLLIEARQRAFQRAEQMVVGGATGALLLSITFLEKLVPSVTVTRPSVLVLAWVLLLGCLSASLLGQHSSARAFDCEMTRLDALANRGILPRNRWATCNRVSDVTAAILLVLGIGFLASFAYMNAPFNAK